MKTPTQDDPGRDTMKSTDACREKKPYRSRASSSMVTSPVLRWQREGAGMTEEGIL